MSNRITTRSYFIKRLRDCGYHVDKIDAIEYAPTDNRKWTVLIDNGGMAVLATCFKNDKIHLYDGRRYIDVIVDISSIESLIEIMNDHGIIRKHYNYGLK